jgi:hypothetical protein
VQIIVVGEARLPVRIRDASARVVRNSLHDLVCSGCAADERTPEPAAWSRERRALMGIADDTKATIAQTKADGKIKVAEVKADTKVKKAEAKADTKVKNAEAKADTEARITQAEQDSLKHRNEAKSKLRDA